MLRVTPLRLLALAGAVTAFASASDELVRVPVTIAEPPNASVVGGGLLELSVEAHPGLPAAAEWTLCARGGEGANISCVACGGGGGGGAGAGRSVCEISATALRPGATTAAVWAVLGSDAGLAELEALVSGPPGAEITVSVLTMTPREVVALPASAEARAAPPSTSQSWWGRSTREAAEEALRAAREQVRAAREAEAAGQDGPAHPAVGGGGGSGEDGDGESAGAVLPLPAALERSPVPVPPAVPPPPPLSLRRHRTFLGPDLGAAEAEAAAAEAELAAEMAAEGGGAGPPERRLPVLVAVAAGARGAAVVNDTLTRLHAALAPTRGVDIVLLAYDGTDWDAVAAGTAPGAAAGDEAVRGTWAEDATVVRRRGHMKWWLVKRFLHPDVASSGAYGWVVVLDEDAALAPSFSPLGFFASLERHGVRIGQPLHADASNTSFPFLQSEHARALVALEGDKWRGRNTLDGEAAGEGGRGEGVAAAVLWTTMVECGPVTAFDAREAWPCVWGLLQPDLASGFGYDLLWAETCASDLETAEVDADGSGGDAPTAPPARAGVVLSEELVHADLGTASGRRAGFFRRAVAEALTLFERRRREAGQDADGAGQMTPARAMRSLALSLGTGPEAGAFPSEPRVVGVGWETTRQAARAA